MVHVDTAAQWARLRFAVIGKLLASPPAHGELRQMLSELAVRSWRHPITGEQVRFGFSTIERWFYEAQRSSNPIDSLRRKTRKDAGSTKVISARLSMELEAQYRQHPHWSYQLHSDNLTALVVEDPTLGEAPSYTTVRRTMKRNGWRKRPRARTAGQKRALARLESREVRSYELEHVNSLWHFDFHEGSRAVSLPDGSYEKPWCFCLLDDCSRYGCHAQWYLSESAETLAHGFMQGSLKRGIPPSCMSDNGGAMLAAESQQGFSDLGIMHLTTLAASPYQNGKQEVFWGQLEGRLMAMLESVEPLTLEFLNKATQAWLELEYNRRRHSELGVSPLERLLKGPNLARPCPAYDELRFAFTVVQQRTQRRSDGTVSIAGVRFEVPSRMRHCDKLTVRYARWELTRAFIVDPRNNKKVLATIYPLNKARNADRRRRALADCSPLTCDVPTEPIPPLMRKLLADYAATGLPPAYIPLESATNDTLTEDDNDER